MVKKVQIGPFMLLLCLWAWKSCYVYTVEVQPCVYNLNRLEVLMKVLCQIWPKQRLFVSS